MPSIRYMNQSAPFWDFVANMETQGANHPFFNQNRDGGETSGEEGSWGGWGWGWPHHAWHRGPPAFRPRHPPHPPHPSHPPHPGPPPAPPASGDAPDPPEYEIPHEGSENEGNDQPPRGGHGREGHGREGRRGPHGRHAHGHGCRGGRRGFGRGRWGPRDGPFGGSFGMGGLGEFIQSQMFGQNDEGTGEQAQDFKPEVDVFDGESAFVVHASVPGAKKEDIAVNWEAEKSELSITGVTYRPGDEEFLKTLAMDERKVGAFERKVRLGSRANPAQVDVEGISAKLEDGILRVEVPKLDKDFVEIKKVDIE